MATEYGFVYVLGNVSMPNMYKVGFTLSHPRARMDQLSSATACPTPFIMMACFEAENPRMIESEIHIRLSKYRVNESREFFRVPANVLLSLLYDKLAESSVLYCMSRLEDQCEEESIKNSRQIALEKMELFHSQCADPIHWVEHRRNFSQFDDDTPL